MKRPLVGYALCFCCGIYGEMERIEWLVAVAAFLLFLFWWSEQRKTKEKRRIFLQNLLLMMTCMVAGMWCGNKENKRQMFIFPEGKVEASAEGIVTKIENKPEKVRYRLENVTLSMQKKQYYFEGITVEYPLEQLNSIQKQAAFLGKRVRFEGTAQCYEGASNPAGFDAKQYYGASHDYLKFNGEKASIQKAPDSMRQQLQLLRSRFSQSLDEIAEPDDAGILKTMLLADKSSLEETTKQIYTESGIGHLLCISGLHITVISMAFLSLFRRIFSKKTAIFFSSMIIFLFCMMTGMQTASLRAMAMFFLTVGAVLAGRTYDILTALSFSAVLILVVEPAKLFQAGFLLSFSAILGIILISPTIQYLCAFHSTKKIPKKLQESFCSGLSIFLANVPVLLYFYYELPIYSIFLNMCVLPFVGFLLTDAILSGMVGIFLPAFGQLFILPAHFILVFYRKLCEMMQQLPFAIQIFGRPKLWKIVVYYSILGTLLIYLHEKERRELLEQEEQNL